MMSSLVSTSVESSSATTTSVGGVDWLVVGLGFVGVDELVVQVTHVTHPYNHRDRKPKM